MSKEGIQRIADLLEAVQRTRVALLGGDKQDVFLSNLCAEMDNHVKNDFCKITCGKYNELEGRP